MIALDTNVLVYADRRDLPQHAAARRALEALATGHEPVGLPVFAAVEYVRVVTHPKLFAAPTKLADALDNLAALLAHPRFELLLPGPDFWTQFDALSRGADARGNLAFDTQIAALCLEHRVAELWTADRDFARFRGLRIRNPIEE